VIGDRKQQSPKARNHTRLEEPPRIFTPEALML
ncbi:hypothetical protein CCACVL1_22945, partial [Corchorus capsularis]